MGKADFSAAIERKRVTVETKWREEGISEKKIAEALSFCIQPAPPSST